MIQLLSADTIDQFLDLKRNILRIFFQVGGQFAPIIAQFGPLQFGQSSVGEQGGGQRFKRIAPGTGPSDGITPRSFARHRSNLRQHR